MKKLLISFLLLYNTLLAQTLQEQFPTLNKSEIEHYKTQKELLPNIDKEFEEFDNFDEEQKQKFKEKVNILVPPIRTEEKRYVADYLLLFAPLMNYKAYIFIDKYHSDSKSFYTGQLIAQLLHQSFPKNFAYADTYLWGQVKAGNYKEPLEKFPHLLVKSNYNTDIQEHYDYVLKISQYDLQHLMTSDTVKINLDEQLSSFYDTNKAQEIKQIIIDSSDGRCKKDNTNKTICVMSEDEFKTIIDQDNIIGLSVIKETPKSGEFGGIGVDIDTNL